jgi:metal-responsive CopG/Arc/MetJ family transcriptional regulator
MRINITLPEELFKEAHSFSDKQYWSFSELIKNALVNYMGSSFKDKIQFKSLDLIKEEEKLLDEGIHPIKVKYRDEPVEDFSQEFHPQPKGVK